MERAQTRICTAYSKFTPQLGSSIQSRAGGKDVYTRRSNCDPHYLRSSGREDRRLNVACTYARRHYVRPRTQKYHRPPFDVHLRCRASKRE